MRRMLASTRTGSGLESFKRPACPSPAPLPPATLHFASSMAELSMRKWVPREGVERDVTKWTLLGLLVDGGLKLSVSVGLPAVSTMSASVRVCNVVQHGQQMYRRPGRVVELPTRGLRDRAARIVAGVRKALWTHGWSVIAADERLPGAGGAVDAVADSPLRPEDLALVEVKVRSFKATAELDEGRRVTRADALVKFEKSPRPWTKAVIVTVVVDLQRPSSEEYMYEEIARTSRRAVRESGWADLGLSRKRPRSAMRAVLSAPRERRAELPAWRYLEGLQFAELPNRHKAVHLASYCRAAMLGESTGRHKLAVWSEACSWPADAYQQLAGATATGGAPADYVSVKALKKLHELRRKSQL